MQDEVLTSEEQYEFDLPKQEVVDDKPMRSSKKLILYETQKYGEADISNREINK